jgi:hypothetical protein
VQEVDPLPDMELTSVPAPKIMPIPSAVAIAVVQDNLPVNNPIPRTTIPIVATA